MRGKWEGDRGLYLLAAMIGAAAFIAVYGVHVLNPVYDDWLLGRGDLTQHYLGWCFYRRGNWTFPLGLTDRLAYPSYTSVIFTDSIPLLAVFFKVLSPVLPDKFQYFGWWGIASFALQGFFSARILREFSVGKMQTLIGSVFFILSPVVIEKMFRHTALGGHWIVLTAVYFYVRHQKDYHDIWKTTLCWGSIGALVGTVHLYFLPMCGAFVCGYVLCSLLKDRRIRLCRLFPGAAFGGALLTGTYLMGGFSTRAAATEKGLGECSFNLNGFFNAKGYSRFFDALPMYHECQYEGFAYLGAGIFVLVFVSLVFMIVKLAAKHDGCDRDNRIQMLVSGLMAAGLVLFAASPVITWNDKLLFVLTDSSTLTHYWSIFRATGRIIWPVYYLIYTAVIVCNNRLWKKCMKDAHAGAAAGTAALAVCCLVQIFDIGGKLADQRERFSQKTAYASPLKDNVWDELSGQETLRHFVWVSNSYENYQLLELSKWAYDNMLTMNNFYFARGLSVIEDTEESLQNPNDTYLFVFKPEELPEYQDCGLNFYGADGYVVGTIFELEQERYHFDEF